MSAEAFRPTPQIQFAPSPYSSHEFTSPFGPKHHSIQDDFDGNKSRPNLHLFKNDLNQIETLQNRFNEELGISKTDKLNYNPVLARWKFESLSTPEDIEQFKNYELWQIRTALYERNQVEKNSVNYRIGEDGEIYNELFPDEPFRNVLLRGLAYQKENGSVEPEREQSEYEGWEQISSILKDPNTKPGTKAIVISPPGIAPGSMYQHNFIDIYEKHEGFIKMTRTNSSLSYEAYKQIVEYFDPEYFHGYEGPADAWHLKKPIYRTPDIDMRSVAQIITDNFGITDNQDHEQKKQQAWELVEAVAKHFLEEGICRSEFDPQEIARKWNALLVKNDIVWESIKNNSALSTHAARKEFKNIQDEVAWLSTQEVRAIAAACGSSAGFNLNQGSAKVGAAAFSEVMESVQNSVAQFGLDKDKYGDRKFDCPKCHYKNTRPYGKLIERCQSCGSTDVACKEH